MTQGFLPHFDFEQSRSSDVLVSALRRSDWAAYFTSEGGMSHLFAARRQSAKNVDEVSLKDRLELPSGLVSPGERLLVGTADEDSTFPGSTYVDYTGRDPVNLEHIVSELIITGERAAMEQHAHLRRLEALGTAGGLAVLGIAYALIHRH